MCSYLNYDPDLLGIRELEKFNYAIHKFVTYNGNRFTLTFPSNTRVETIKLIRNTETTCRYEITLSIADRNFMFICELINTKIFSNFSGNTEGLYYEGNRLCVNLNHTPSFKEGEFLEPWFRLFIHEVRFLNYLN